MEKIIFSVRIEKELKNKVKVHCAKRKIKIEQFTSSAINEALKRGK